MRKTYGDEMKRRRFDDSMINVSDGDIVSEISKLARTRLASRLWGEQILSP